MVRRFEVGNLERLTERVRGLFGGCELVVNSYGSLLRTTLQMQTIIVRYATVVMKKEDSCLWAPSWFRISSNRQQEVQKLKELGEKATIEIGSAYSELAILRDGRLQIPCNVSFQPLLKFMKENVIVSQQINRITKQQRVREDMHTKLLLH